MLCVWVYCHVLACTCFSYQRRGPGRPYLEPLVAGPAGPCPCSLWSRHGRRSRSTACACWLQEKGRDRRRNAIYILLFFIDCISLTAAAEGSEMSQNDRTKTEALLLCWCHAFVSDWCAVFFFLLQLTGQLMEVLRWRRNDFHLHFTWLAWLWKVSFQNTTNLKKKNSFKRDEIFNITNPICSLFAPSVYTNITHAGWVPREDTDTHVPHF